MAAKELLTQVKLQVPAGAANPAPPVGPALGQHGLNIQDFCKQFNDKTKDAEKGTLIIHNNPGYGDGSEAGEKLSFKIPVRFEP